MPQLITKDRIKEIVPCRDRNAYKGDFGRVLIIAGSEGMMGAAVLSARGALRSGAGLVTVACDRSFFCVVHAGIPEAMCLDRDLIGDELRKYDAVAIGPGLRVSEKTQEVLKTVLERYAGPLILDADALNVLSAHNDLIKNSSCRCIMTPHEGEAARLLQIDSEEISENRENAVKTIARQFSCICVLKGAATLVSTAQGELYKNTTGNPGMATGGAGDVLTGMIASFSGQFGNDLQQNLKAALAGVYLHGRAGDLAARELGEYGLIAGDIANFIPYAIKELIGDVIM